MAQSDALEVVTRRRVRSLRQARGWSLQELGRRANVGPSTLSRLETGKRRFTLDHLVALARALDTTADELLLDHEEEEVVIRPRRNRTGDSIFWSLNAANDPSDRIVVKMRLRESQNLPETRVHPGRDWFYVLEGRVRLKLGDRELIVPAGKAASFNTMTLHSMGGHQGAAEILSILDRHGEREHLHS